MEVHPVIKHGGAFGKCARNNARTLRRGIVRLGLMMRQVGGHR